MGAVLLTAGGLIANSSAGFSQLRMEMEAVKQTIQRNLRSVRQGS